MSNIKNINEGFFTDRKEVFTFDTEFIEDGKTIDLISIGIVNVNTGEELYCVSSEFDPNKADDWVKKNVLDKISPNEKKYSKKEIKEKILKFCGKQPEFWAYYASYDWIVFCQIFGKMLDLPSNYPKYCLDIKQEIIRQGLTKDKLPKDPENEHNALIDAKWNVQVLSILFPQGQNIQDTISEKDQSVKEPIVTNKTKIKDLYTSHKNNKNSTDFYINQKYDKL